MGLEDWLSFNPSSLLIFFRFFSISRDFLIRQVEWRETWSKISVWTNWITCFVLEECSARVDLVVWLMFFNTCLEWPAGLTYVKSATGIGNFIHTLLMEGISVVFNLGEYLCKSFKGFENSFNVHFFLGFGDIVDSAMDKGEMGLRV